MSTPEEHVSHEGDELRRRAEEIVDERLPAGAESEQPDPERIMALMHDLQVHQIELQMQNEQLQRTRDELETARDQYQRLYDFAPVGYATVDVESRIREANLTLTEMLGIERRRMRGDSLRMHVVPEHQALLLLTLQSAMSEGAPRQVQLELLHRSGTRTWVIMRAQPAPESEDGLCWLSLTDIGELHAAQENLFELNRSLENRISERTRLAEKRAARLARLASELSRVEQKERQRLAGHLHDHLQQLLAGARLQLELVRRHNRQEDLELQLAKLLGLLEKSMESTRSLTLELSPPILRHGQLPDAMLWLADWIKKTHLIEVDCHIDQSADPGLPELRTMLFDATRELLFNVRKHSGTTRAELQMFKQEGRLEIVISDRGTGLPPGLTSDLDRATGFGLFAIRERLEALGGSLQVQGRAGGGTEVRLVLPLVGESVVESGSGSGLISEASETGSPEDLGLPAPKPPQRPVRVGARTVSILLADDHRIVRQGLAGILAEEPDLEVVGEATDGKEAVMLACKLLPDVILMDVTMPLMDGEQATRLIKSYLPHVRVVALSMHNERRVMERIRSAGADAYVTKGCRIEELLAAVRG
jgi:PAS domain S-box-containing protein